MSVGVGDQPITWNQFKLYSKVLEKRITQAVLEALKKENTFINLSDVPSSYAGAGGKTLKVKTSGDGIEFTT